MERVSDYTDRQTKVNESIRSAYAFVKYTERIKTDAPWAHESAVNRWLETITEGVDLMKEVAANVGTMELASLASRFVKVTTVMRQRVYTEMCAQGPCDRETWEFPWETQDSHEYPEDEGRDLVAPSHTRSGGAP